MKTVISVCWALLALSSAHAQIFKPESANRDRSRSGGRGGEQVDRDRPRGNAGGGYSRGHQYHGSGYGHRGHDHRGGYWHVGYDWPRYRYSVVPTYGYYAGYGVDYPYYGSLGYYGAGSGASTGLVLGALAGGIIGHNSGDFRHNGWRGAAWGAGLGWLLGSVADANRRAVAYERAPVVVQAAPVTPAQTAPQAQPQQVTIINNYYNTSTPMTAANGLFGR